MKIVHNKLSMKIAFEDYEEKEAFLELLKAGGAEESIAVKADKEEFNLSEKIFLTRDDSDMGDGTLPVIHTTFVKEFIRLLKENFRYRESKHQKLDLNIIELMIDKLAGSKLIQ